MLWTRTITILGLACIASAFPGRQQPLAPVPIKHASPRPLVVWHGLGDTSDSEGMATLKRDIEEMYPGIFVMSVKVPGEGSLDDERKAGFVSLPSVLSCFESVPRPDVGLTNSARDSGETLRIKSISSPRRLCLHPS